MTLEVDQYCDKQLAELKRQFDVAVQNAANRDAKCIQIGGQIEALSKMKADLNGKAAVVADIPQEQSNE